MIRRRRKWTTGDVDNLIEELARPLFVYHMAKGVVDDEDRPEDRISKGARTKLLNARREIHQIVRRYCNG